jgi:hypothetical protein
MTSTTLALPRPRKLRSVFALPLMLLSLTVLPGCDVAMADLKHNETAEWRKTYELAPGGQVKISNVNGKIDVSPSTGSTVEVVAQKVARGANAETAKAALDRVEIRDESSSSSVSIETKIPRGGGWFEMGSVQVKYMVRVPADAEVSFTTVNGGVEINGLNGRITASTTNGGVVARGVSGSIVAETTNGGVEVDLARLAEGGAKLSCTNGGIVLRLPRESKATISASITNGGIDTGGLTLQTTQNSRRRLEGQMNGGGAPIEIHGTNGGIKIGGM